MSVVPTDRSTSAPPRLGQPQPPAGGRPGAGRRPVPRRRPPAPRPWVADAAAVGVGVGLGASMALPVANTSWAAVRAPGGWATLLGDVTAQGGTFLLLVMVLLAGRVPAVERVLGHDRMIRWHRRTTTAPLLLLGAHAVLTTLGSAEGGRSGFWSAGGSLVTTMAWIFAAVVSYVMIVAIAGVSIRAVRRRFSYDTWWVIHCYTYLALAFSVPHQIFDGTDFVGHPLARVAWTLLWLGTAGVVIVFRLGLPAWRSLYHRFEVVEVRPEGRDAYSLVIKGRHVERLAVAGGQWFAWRFLVRGMWWHAHPFSLSALPAPPYLRVTVKVSGDTTGDLGRLQPGTKVAVEGPYGAFTEAARTRAGVALIGAGVGITPLRALLEDLPHGVDVVVVQRASSEADMLHHDELAALVDARGGRLVALAGPRRRHQLDDPRGLQRVVPDLGRRDLFLCGPDAFTAGVAAAARRLGVDAGAIHFESFTL
ncbi:MAG TPA: ferredoxin reductase family protein [Acidimicrobiales bacterium]|nr:ferredoxin reductase family protein [Acidimicrobiales bacterium]